MPASEKVKSRKEIQLVCTFPVRTKKDYFNTKQLNTKFPDQLLNTCLFVLKFSFSSCSSSSSTPLFSLSVSTSVCLSVSTTRQEMDVQNRLHSVGVGEELRTAVLFKCCFLRAEFEGGGCGGREGSFRELS